MSDLLEIATAALKLRAQLKLLKLAARLGPIDFGAAKGEF